MIDNVTHYEAVVIERQAELDDDGYSTPELTTYTVRAINTEAFITLTEMLPNRRVASGAKIIPAEVRDPCLIQVWGDGTHVLWMTTEGIPFKDCSDVANAVPNGLRQLVDAIQGLASGR